MKLKHLSIAIIAASLPMTGVFAAAMDRSGQSISAFLQPNNYFEAGISVLDPTVEGREAGDTPKPYREVSDMGDDYYFPSAAIKLQLTDQVSFGLLYDKPFGADAAYSGENAFVSSDHDTVLPQDRLTALRATTITKNVNEQVVARATQQAIAATGSPTPPSSGN